MFSPAASACVSLCPAAAHLFPMERSPGCEAESAGATALCEQVEGETGRARPWEWEKVECVSWCNVADREGLGARMPVPEGGKGVSSEGARGGADPGAEG